MRAGPLARATSAAIAVAGIVFVTATGARATTLVAVPQQWSQYQGDAQHTGSTSSAPAAPFRVAWSAPSGIGDTMHFAGVPAPVVAGDDAIVVDREDVTATSLASGTVAWTVPRQLGPSAPAAVVATKDATTIVYTEGGGDLSSSASGTPTPTPPSPLPTPSASPTSSASATASTADRSTLVAIDASTQVVLWRHSLPGVSIGGPTIDGSTVLVGTHEGSVTAVAVGSGDQEWTVDLGDSISSPIATAGGIAYVSVAAGSGQAGFLVALREADQQEVWRFSAGGAGISVGAPTVANGTVYVTVSDGSVRAFDAASGASRWAAKMNTVSGVLAPPLTLPMGGPPAVSNGAVVVSDIRGQVYRFDAATGDRAWDFAMNDHVYGSTVIAGSLVVVGDSSGTVSAIDLETGERIWRQNVGEGLLLGFAVTPDSVVAARTGPSAGLVSLVADPNGALIREQSPTIVEPVQLGLAWAVAAVPIVILLILAGRFLDARLGPATFGSGDDGEPVEEDLE